MTLYKSEGLPKVVDVVELALFIDYKDYNSTVENLRNPF